MTAFIRRLKAILPPLSGALALCFFTGCAGTYKPVPHLSKIHENHVISTTASMTSSFLISPASGLVHCNPPPPDAAYAETAAGDLSLSLVSLGGSSEGAEESSAGGETEMQGRTLSVLLARELLFRVCEFGRNNRLTPEQATELYKVNLDIIKSVSATEAQNTTMNITESLSETVAVQESESIAETATTSATETESETTSQGGSQ